MYDQARILRGLMERRSEPSAAENSATPACAHTVAVTSGKGGVGKSNIALNLAISIARMGHSVCLLDANLGLGNIDLLCGPAKAFSDPGVLVPVPGSVTESNLPIHIHLGGDKPELRLWDGTRPDRGGPPAPASTLVGNAARLQMTISAG